MIEYLNRETVMKELDRNSITKKITFSDGVSIYDSIQKLPAADVVEVKHGHWELRPSGHYSHVGSFCSVCGKKSGIGGIRENQLKPYCPNCGAKMDGERSSNE